MAEPCSPGGWTLDTLEKYLTEKIAALEKFCATSFAQSKERVDMALASSDKAITKAEQTTERRFEGVNEFRSALSDQSALMLTRTEWQAQQRLLTDRVAMLSDSLAKMEARTLGKHEGIGTIGTVVVGAMIGLNSLAALAALAIALLRH